MSDLSVEPTIGLAAGDTIQFVEGHLGNVGAGIAIREEAFFLLESHLRAAWDGWVSERRYGVSELPAPTRTTLVESLRQEAVELRTGSTDGNDKAEFFEQVADWLATRCDECQPISILGV